MKNAIPTIILALAFLTPALVGIIRNQMDPSLASAMTVAYLAAGGVILGIVATGITTLLGWLREGYKPNHVIVASCFALSVLIFILANLGMLSVVQ
ncbi:MAG: hypothetical protein AAFN91_11260 [Pseudomonadota bacterium]